MKESLSTYRPAAWAFVRSLIAGVAARVLGWLADGYQARGHPKGHWSFPFIKKRHAQVYQILAYHRVNDENDPLFPAISTIEFARQMEALTETFTVCSLGRLFEATRTGDIPDRAIAVTFDDGYRDNYINAFPILKRYSIPATIFLATGAIGSGQALWHDIVFAAFRKSQTEWLAGLGSNIGRLPLRTLSEKLEAQKCVLELLWSMDSERREITLQRLLDCLQVQVSREVDGLMLSWKDVMEMRRNGIDFGAHTVTHPILSRLSRESAAREINDSIRTIEERLTAPVTSFAYPVGRKNDFNSTTKDLLRDSGCDCAVTMIFGSNESGADPYELRRIALWNGSADVMGLRLGYYKFCS